MEGGNSQKGLQNVRDMIQKEGDNRSGLALSFLVLSKLQLCSYKKCVKLGADSEHTRRIDF